MAHTLLLHIANDDPVVVETDRIPEPGDTNILCMHPRRRDNKEVQYILPDVTTVIFPMWRINFIEIMPSSEDEELIRPFRD